VGGVSYNIVFLSLIGHQILGLLLRPRTTTPEGHSLRLYVSRSNLWVTTSETTSQTKFFSQRSVNDWNRLPQTVVDATSVNMFKNRLDAHWKDMASKAHYPTSTSKYKYSILHVHLCIIRFRAFATIRASLHRMCCM